LWFAGFGFGFDPVWIRRDGWTEDGWMSRYGGRREAGGRRWQGKAGAFIIHTFLVIPIDLFDLLFHLFLSSSKITLPVVSTFLLFFRPTSCFCPLLRLFPPTPAGRRPLARLAPARRLVILQGSVLVLVPVQGVRWECGWGLDNGLHDGQVRRAVNY
jgi:hypothetical protein